MLPKRCPICKTYLAKTDKRCPICGRPVRLSPGAGEVALTTLFLITIGLLALGLTW